jgi:Photosynthesis system II assembly factor YCF48
MSEFPEVARQRLSRVARGGEHPDAGLLTALVEGTLTKTNRDGVFAHLVTCSECNRLVALIAPEREVASVAQPAEVRRRWFAWVPVRWAGVAAAAAVVVSAVVIGRIERQVKVPAAPSVAVEKAPLPSMTAQLPVPVTVQPGAPPPPNRASQPATRPRRQGESAAFSRKPAVAPIDPAIAAQSRPAVPGRVRGQTAFQTSMASSPGSPSEMSPAVSEPVQPLVKATPAPAGTANIPPAPARSIGPIWSVSAGVLRRSKDSGHTWTAMAVPSRVPLHALSVLGGDIWTGGDQGALFHSSDSGQTWTAVVPTWNGTTLSGDIMRIAFSDPRHGGIATRNGDVWMTRDGGATWSRQ